MELTEFQKRALEIDKHISLTANAGSGKTFVLAKRFVEIALRQELPLNKIAAITFTEKAAGELYVKISKEINERIAKEKNPNVKRKLLRIRNQLVSSNISTIHSFCNSLLKEFAPEAGLDTNFAVIDASVANDLIDMIIADFIETNIAEEAESPEVKNDLLELIRIFGSTRALIANLRLMFYKRKTILKLYENIYDKKIEDIAANFHNKANLLLEEFLGIDLNLFLSNLIALNAEVLSADPRNKFGNEFLEVCSRVDIRGSDVISNLRKIKFALKPLLTQNGKLRKRGYLQKIKNVALPVDTEELQRKIDLLREVDFDDEIIKSELSLAKTGKLLMNVFRNLVEIYEEKKKEQSYIDLEDLLLETLKLLKNKEVQAMLSNKFKHILVDEYQDTNEVQYEILMPLLNELKKGKLFIVGDDKQSIYMFREAELEVFGKTTERIKLENKGEGVVELPHSFRLAPNIAFFTNQVFSKVFANPNPKFNEVGYSNLISTRALKEGGGVEILLSEEDSGEAEAALVAAKIQELRNQTGIPFASIAVLCARRDWFSLISKSLNERNLPFTIIGSKGFFQNQVIADVYNYLAFLIDQSDDAALVGILRSPFFFVKDEDLFKISLERGESFYEKLASFARKNKKAAEIVENIEENISNASSLPLNQLLRRIVVDSGYYSIIAARREFPNQLANLNKLLNISVEFQNEPFNSYYDFVEYLKNSIEKNVEEGESDLTSATGAIQIMTIHQAKGLEFDAVFIFKAHEKMRPESIKSKEITIEKDLGIMTKVPIDNDYFSPYKKAPIAAVAQYYLRQKQLAEFKRLFYVAVTRAKNHLFISGVARRSNQDNSFLGMLGAALGVDFKKEEILLSGSLEILQNANGKNREREEKINLTIPITRKIEIEKGKETSEQEKELISESQIAVQNVEDIPENEIFSATRLSIYLQCPLKYKLIYELGMGKLLKTLENINFNLTNNEDNDDYLPANIAGSIIHKALEKEIDAKGIVDFVRNELVNYSMNSDASEGAVKNIADIIERYQRSDLFKEISAFEKYFNEFNIYLRENDYYLFGIIDKLIITDEYLLVIDYKTDIIEESGIREKFSHYLNQLMFYAYIVKKYFNERKKIFAQLVFVRKPELSVKKEITLGEVNDFGKIITKAINGIQSREYTANISHCKHCQFYENGKCVYL